MGNRSKCFPNARRVHFKPEIRNCPHCGAKLRYDHPTSRKFVITLTETIFVVNQGWRCPRSECPGHRVFFRSAVGEALSLKQRSYGMDVPAEIGYLRFHEHHTREEIHQALRERGVSISEREVQNLYEEYAVLLRCSASDKIAERRPQMSANGGLVISVDGVQPEKGNESLWGVREVLTGTTLNAANLATGDAANLTELLRPVLDVSLPVLGVVSDAQKSIRNAVSGLFPGVPHQLCHFHFLRDIALPTVNEDRALKTDLKHELRGIKQVEQQVTQRMDSDAEVIKGFATALRTVLLEDGLPPLELPGVKIYEELDAISQSLQRCVGKKGAPLLDNLLKIACRHQQHHQTYLTLKQQQTWLRHIDTILDPNGVKPPCVLGPERASEAARELWAYLEDIRQQSSGNLSHEHFARYVRKWVKNLGGGLYACFSQPLLPRTNNGMERFLRTLKAQHRRITGRQSWSRYILRYGAQIAFHEPTESDAAVLQRLTLVRYEDFRQSRSCWRRGQEVHRQRIRYRRNRSAFLAHLEQTWSI